MNSVNPVDKIEPSLLEEERAELLEVFIHVQPEELHKITKHLQNMQTEVPDRVYHVLGLILVRLPVRDLYSLAEDEDVIRIFGAGNFQRMQQQEEDNKKQGDGHEDDQAGCGGDSPSIEK